MIQLDVAAMTTRTPLEELDNIPMGRSALIILERDGSLHQYSPAQGHPAPSQAMITLNQEEAKPGLIDHLLAFAFDILDVTKLELRIHEQPEA